MKLLVAAALVLVIFAIVVIVALIIAAIWWRRAAGRRPEGRDRAAAAAFLRRHGDDPRVQSQLRRLAADAKTPADARLLLSALARYLANPIVLAPPEVPVLGRFDEIAVGSMLLWLAWGRLSPGSWEEHVPDAIPAASPADEPASIDDPAGGRLAAALRRDLAMGRHAELLRRLDRALPDWPVSAALIDVARELIDSMDNVEAARAAGVPEGITGRLAQETRAAGDALWLRADRLVAVAAYRIETPALQEALAREEGQLRQLRLALRDARTGLAELTLSEGRGEEALQRAEGRFRALGAAARELRAFDQEQRP